MPKYLYSLCAVLVILDCIASAPLQGPPTIANLSNTAARTALLWSSISLAVVTSILQSIVTTMVAVAEDANMWTWRFRIARYEHWWWTGISALLAASFSLIVVSFVAGNNSDATGVLVLSSVTLIAIVRYASPAWRNRHFIENRWLSWAGPSRTAIPASVASLCGDSRAWHRLAQLKQIHSIRHWPSDEWGPTLFGAPRGLADDPTAILSNANEMKLGIAFDTTKYPNGYTTYSDGVSSADVSLLWGAPVGFRPRCSRAVSSMPITLLQSRPFTVDGYSGEGLCLAMGILGRNKGLQPWTLVYDEADKLKASRGIHRSGQRITAILENTSSFTPRPNKVMRSYYSKTMKDQFGGISEAYCAAATELSLLMLDCPHHVLREWLTGTLEQQSLTVNHYMQQTGREKGEKSIVALPEEMNALYRSSLVSTIISLNYFKSAKGSGATHYRPDLICFCLLWLAEHAVKRTKTSQTTPVQPSGPEQIWYVQGDGAPMPAWWTEGWVQQRLDVEIECLRPDFKQAAALLLGLREWPLLRESWPGWPTVVYQPTYT